VAPSVTVIHDALLSPDHGHPADVEIRMSQREIADGAVEVVVDDPHPDAMPIAGIAAEKANNRRAGDNRVALMMFNVQRPKVHTTAEFMCIKNGAAARTWPSGRPRSAGRRPN